MLSDEALYNDGCMKDGFWERELPYLKENNIELKVIIYIRRQDLYAWSHYAQLVRGPSKFTFTMDKYISDTANGKRNHLDYGEYLDKLAHQIGKENIIVRTFERECFKNGSIVDDYLECVGLEHTDDYAVDEAIVNTSDTDSIVCARRYMNKVKIWHDSNMRMTSEFTTIQNELKAAGKLRKRTGFTKEKRDAMLERYKVSNEYVAREFLKNPDGVLFRDMNTDLGDEKARFKSHEIKKIYKRLLELNKEIEEPPFTDGELKMICDSAYNHLKADLKAGSFRNRVKRKLKRMLGRKK